MHFGTVLDARQSGVQCYMWSDRPQQFGSRYVPGVLSAFSNPMEGCWWRHEGLSNNPFPGQHALYDQTSEADGNGWSRTEVDNLWDASLLCWTRAMDTEYAKQAQLVKGIHRVWQGGCLWLLRGNVGDNSTYYWMDISLTRKLANVKSQFFGLQFVCLLSVA